MKYLLVVLAMLCCKPVHSTTIVIYITPRFVIMGADSKVVFTNMATGRESEGQVSKIYQRDQVYFALAGIAYNAAKKLDIAKVTDRCLKENKTFDRALLAIKKEVTSLLSAYLTDMRGRSLSLYKRNLAATDYITSIGFITIKAGKPYAHLMGFKVTDAAQVSVATEEVFFVKNSTRDAVYYLGQKDAINAYMDTFTTVTEAPEVFVEHLIQLQIDKTPDLVSLPIDMIELTPRKAVWLKRKKGTPVRFK